MSIPLKFLALAVIRPFSLKAAGQPLIPPSLIVYIGESITNGAGLKKEEKAPLAPPALCTEFLKKELHQPSIFSVISNQ